MSEFLLCLCAMTASHHQWTLPPQNPPAVVETAPEKAALGVLTPGEERALRIALNHIARCSTGKMPLGKFAD